MQLLNGIPLSPGYAEGIAAVYAYGVQPRLEIPRYRITSSEIDGEHHRLDEARSQAKCDLSEAERTARSESNDRQAADVLRAHAEIVDGLVSEVRQLVSRERLNVEQALECVIDEMCQRLCDLEDGYLDQREQDVRDVGHRILRHLIGSPNWCDASLPPNTVRRMYDCRRIPVRNRTTCRRR